MALKVAIQGVKASFHDVAARSYFSTEEVTPIECATFRDLCESLKSKKAEVALMAIENSIAGSILPNYSLLENFHFRIIGEIFLRIEMNLMALPGQKIIDLKFVQSHPMALFQCEDFLNDFPHLKILEASDTAESAKDISEKKLMEYGAIASGLASKTYNLQILREGIETNKQNYTRFLVITSQIDTKVENANKSTLRFQTPHEPGSLVGILKIFEKFKVNMTKIQSVPIIGKPYEYSFHVDLEFSDQDSYKKSFSEIKTKALNVIEFGEYLRGERPWT